MRKRAGFGNADSTAWWQLVSDTARSAGQWSSARRDRSATARATGVGRAARKGGERIGLSLVGGACGYCDLAGAQNPSTGAILQEHHRPQIFALPVFFHHQPGLSREVLILGVSNHCQAPGNAGMRHHPPAVLTARDVGLQAIFRNCQRYIGIGSRHVVDLHCQARRTGAAPQTYGCLRSLGCLGDRPEGLLAVAADELRLSVHHHLRSINAIAPDRRRILSLPFAETWRRERISPPELVPIIDMLAERDHLSAGHRLRLLQMAQQQVRGRTTRATFRCEQLHNHRRPSRFRLSNDRNQQNDPPNAHNTIVAQGRKKLFPCTKTKFPLRLRYLFPLLHITLCKPLCPSVLTWRT